MHVKKDLYQSLTQCVYICGSPENAHYSHKNLRFYRVFGFPGGSTDTIVSAFCLVKRPPPPTGSIMALAQLNEPRCGWLLSRHAPPQNTGLGMGGGICTITYCAALLVSTTGGGQCGFPLSRLPIPRVVAKGLE